MSSKTKSGWLPGVHRGLPDNFQPGKLRRERRQQLEEDQCLHLSQARSWWKRSGKGSPLHLLRAGASPERERWAEDSSLPHACSRWCVSRLTLVQASWTSSPQEVDNHTEFPCSCTLSSHSPFWAGFLPLCRGMSTQRGPASLSLADPSLHENRCHRSALSLIWRGH